MICLLGSSNSFAANVSPRNKTPGSNPVSSANSRVLEEEDEQSSSRSSPSTASEISNASTNEDLSQYSLKNLNLERNNTTNKLDWQTLLVNNDQGHKSPTSWDVHFINPKGQRLHSHQDHFDSYQVNLLKNQGETIIPGTSFCQVSDGQVHHLKQSSLCVEWCNMRQNIFDLKRKRRGRKRSRDSNQRPQQPRRGTTSSEDSSGSSADLSTVTEENPASNNHLPESEDEESQEPASKKSHLLETVISHQNQEDYEKLPSTDGFCESTSIVSDILDDIVIPRSTSSSAMSSKADMDASPQEVIPFIDLDSESKDRDEDTVNVDEQVDPLSLEDDNDSQLVVEACDNRTEQDEDRDTDSSSASKGEHSADLNLYLSSDEDEREVCHNFEIESCNMEVDELIEESDSGDDSDVQIIAVKQKKTVKTPCQQIVNEMKRKPCSIPLVDVFRNSPLDSFLCLGCSRSYGSQDSISIDFQCQIMSVVCSNCSWWTSYRISSKLLEQNATGL